MARPKPIRLTNPTRLPPLTDEQQARIASIRRDFPECKISVQRRGCSDGIVRVSFSHGTIEHNVWYRPDGSVLDSGTQHRLFDMEPKPVKAAMDDIPAHNKPREVRP